MTKTELVRAAAERSDMTQKDTEIALTAIIDTIKDVLNAGEKVQLIGFGTFEVVERKEKVGRNPKTNEEIIIPKHNALKFKVAKELKDSVKDGGQ